jgi:hypothetical protein
MMMSSMLNTISKCSKTTPTLKCNKSKIVL